MEVRIVPRLDVCVVGEINPDLILYGLPKEIKPEEETLVEGFRLTLGSSSAIFAHNLAVLGTRVAIVSKIGDDAVGKLAGQRRRRLVAGSPRGERHCHRTFGDSESARASFHIDLSRHDV